MISQDNLWLATVFLFETEWKDEKNGPNRGDQEYYGPVGVKVK